MRMRKLPWAIDYIKEQKIVIQDPTTMCGTWKQTCHKDVLHVEIGSGKGDYWLHMAQKYSDFIWVGIEKNANVAALALKKHEKLTEPITNALFINDDAEDIANWFEEGEIDVIHLNFSDPWPKKRTHKKRLSNIKFIERYASILSDDGEIQMKTDNVSLFEYSILEFQNANWFLHEFSVDYRRELHDEDTISEYERKFMDKNQPIYRAVWKKHQMKTESQIL